MIVIKKSLWLQPSALHTNTYCQENIHFLFIDFLRDPFGFVMRLIHDQYVWGLDFFSPFFFSFMLQCRPQSIKSCKYIQ